VGIAEYSNQQSDDPVVVKVETGLTNDFFIGFNRATGVNDQNDEGDDVVTVIQVNGNNGSGYSQSYLRAKLGFSGDITGSSYTISDFGGTGVPLIISLVSINIDSIPVTAAVNFQYGSGTLSPTTSSPTTSSPTNSPSDTSICIDTKDQFTVDGKTLFWCSWLWKFGGENVSSRCSKKDLYEDCPVSCGMCSCTDRTDEWEYDGKTKYWCRWARKLGEASFASRCEEKQLYADCPVTCGRCPP